MTTIVRGFLLLLVVTLSLGLLSYYDTKLTAQEQPTVARTNPAEEPKFLLSSEENMELRVYRAELNALNQQQRALSVELNAYVARTMTAHNNPKTVAFDFKELTWRYINQTPVAPPAATTQPAPATAPANAPAVGQNNGDNAVQKNGKKSTSAKK